MFPIKRDSFVSYPIAVTILLTAILAVGFIGIYQIEKVEGQLTNTSSVSELIDEGNLLLNFERYTEALSLYEKALEADPKSVSALFNKGLALHHLDRYEEAINWYDKALLINPEHTDALYGKGAALRDLARDAEAITWFDKALEVDPTHAEALY